MIFVVTNKNILYVNDDRQQYNAVMIVHYDYLCYN